MTGMLLGDIYSKGGNRITSPAALVVPGGLEPPLTEPKTVVLPLHHRTIKSDAKVADFFSTTKLF